MSLHLQLTTQNLIVFGAIVCSNFLAYLWYLPKPTPLASLKAWLTRTSLRTFSLIASIVLTIWTVIFVFYGFPVTGDAVFFYDAGVSAIRGGIPTSDFPTPYMPLLHHYFGLAVLAWDNSLSIPLLLAASYIGIVPFLLRLTDEPEASRVDHRAIAVVGFLNGASWFLAIGYQQDEVVALLFAVGAICLLNAKREMLAGAVLGLGFMSTKLLFALTGLALLTQCTRPRDLILGGLVAGVPILVVFVVLGFDPFAMVSASVFEFSSPSLVADFAAPIHPWLRQQMWIIHGSTVILTLLSGWYLWRHRQVDFRPLRAFAALTLVWLVFLLFAAKSLTSYRLVILPLIPFVLAHQPRRRNFLMLLFLVYSSALGTQYMFYEDWIRGSGGYWEFLQGHWGNTRPLLYLSFVLTLDVIIIFSEIVYVVISMKSIRAPASFEQMPSAAGSGSS